MRFTGCRRQLVVVVSCIFILAPSAQAQRTALEPGINIYSPEDDIKIGRQFIEESEPELAIIDDEILAEYVNRLGQQLALEAPGYRYPYQFKLVNDTAINAFALPGGPIYLNRGIFEHADREAEVAGVLAHEIAHVALRHGTNQASKSQLVQAPLAILGGIFGGGGITSILTEVGIGFAANSLFLKYSRDAERQADLLGAQVLFDAGYDPTGMPEFFEKLEAEQGEQGTEFFSSHPNPGNRAAGVAEEIQRIEDLPPTFIDNSSDFRRIKDRLADVPEDTGERRQTTEGRRGTRRPAPPSTREVRYRNNRIQFYHPANWEAYGGDNAITIAPDGGFGENGLSHGVMVSIFEPARGRRGPISIEDASDQLIAFLRDANPSLQVGSGYRRGTIDRQPALSVGLAMDSPLGGFERDWLLTVFSPEGDFYYFIAAAPDSEFDRYRDAFQDLFGSIRFR